MSKRCSGCGALLQNSNKNEVGYTPKITSDYCQRCYRITHYDDVTINMQNSIENIEVLEKINQIEDALILWVMDLFDFEANILSNLNDYLEKKDIIVVASKRDLLSDTISNDKLIEFMRKRLRSYGISVKGFVICGDLVKNANDEDNYSIDEINNVIDILDYDKVVVMGMANAGKSTIINALLGNSNLTTSRYPGTTLDIVELKTENYLIIDTPGLTRKDSILTNIDIKLLKKIIPTKQIKPKVFQLREDQTISIGGLVRLDLYGCIDTTCVTYFANSLDVHRSKKDNSDNLWNIHLNEMLSPSLDSNFEDMKKYSFVKDNDKIDIVINGLGFFSISGEVDKLDVYINKNIQAVCREAMI